MVQRSPGILIVDDEAAERAAIGEILAAAGLFFETAGDVERALELAARPAHGVVLLDVGIDGAASERAAPVSDTRSGDGQSTVARLRA